MFVYVHHFLRRDQKVGPILLLGLWPLRRIHFLGLPPSFFELISQNSGGAGEYTFTAYTAHTGAKN